MSSDFFRHLGKRRKDKRKHYNYTQLETDDDELDGRDTTQDEIFSSQVYPLKERKSSSSSSKSVHYLEHQIEEGDSLQKLSLLYRCPVAELKRANRLLSNQEFYALKKIKIPVKSYSILTEILPSAGCGNGAVDDGESVRTFHLGIGRVLNGEERSEAAAFLKKMDEDLTKIRESTKLYKDSLEEAAVTLTTPQFRPLVDDGGTAKFNGADCGLQWKTLILAIFVFALILPVVMVLYTQLHASLVPLVDNSTEIHSLGGS